MAGTSMWWSSSSIGFPRTRSQFGRQPSGSSSTPADTTRKATSLCSMNHGLYMQSRKPNPPPSANPAVALVLNSRPQRRGVAGGSLADIRTMPASRRTKVIVWTIVGVVVVGTRLVRSRLLSGLAQVRIRGAHLRRISSCHQRDRPVPGVHGHLPTNLTQLVPAYIPQIPTTPVADSIDYRVMADGTNWQLTVHSRITGAPRVLFSVHPRVHRRERRQSVTGFHGWVVFRE